MTEMTRSTGAAYAYHERGCGCGRTCQKRGHAENKARKRLYAVARKR